MANGLMRCVTPSPIPRSGRLGLPRELKRRDFIVLVLNIEVFQIKFFLKIKSLKKKKLKRSDERLPMSFSGVTEPEYI